ncbi:endoplasmic reticulum junction formation protein lunapark-A isoform X1 [Frankliniella occidentalis]|uniref:Endoplasmic reticulum junction formation protein lunapark n=1 Tax=Frankliniella occidentalis TaxID=133901 RepID=A0A6J1RZI3_FRAOC|nr:endoplasmic reticulum junction formation protein lunapark-A isoform X1 [Frankliniella occidentalis]XP_026273759.1 endoplasmic reticulum junction formation protein lunapark-A isoform X1 [Frankliniella occidentalis]XP_052127270.1 endoplasmic reticulum junction formation protein lunapark-A isoform X1 [Frankliniella occidentalis]XP_052127271.1 endoplasmic reticulum junction formation protein lunapark-A isoform X1 [Frankliniella occidentalis]
MGLLISRFKRKKTTYELLEKLDKDITSIEKYRTNTEQRQRRIVGQLVVYSVGAYVLAAALFYFYWFPSTLREQLICVTPLLLFPIVVLLLKRILTFYYSRKITKNEQKLCDLRAEKKKILEDVMDKETYKVAKTILEKFAPEQLRSKGLQEANSTPNKLNAGKTPLASAPRGPVQLHQATPSRPVAGLSPTELRRRTLPSALGNQGPNTVPPSSISSDSLSTAAMQRAQFLSGTPMHRPSANGQSFSSEYRPPGPPLPRPVLPRERSYLDRVVDYVVGDGPSNRFALICSSCDSHNGMALKEEFEYLSFRCSYCHYYNPARKQRPQAPRLSPVPGSKLHAVGQLQHAGKSDDTSDSEKNSGSDSSDDDSAPEPQLLNNSDATDKKDQADTSLDREADEFLKSLDGKEGKSSSVEPPSSTGNNPSEEAESST